MAVLGGLFHHSGVNGVTLFKGVLRRGPLGDEVGNPRLRARFLLSLGEAVEEVCGGEAANGDVETALFSEKHISKLIPVALVVCWDSLSSLQAM